jgi:hypothetical protein
LWCSPCGPATAPGHFHASAWTFSWQTEVIRQTALKYKAFSIFATPTHKVTHSSYPHNISLLPLPPRSPELNSQENIWQFMRQNWLSNRVFKSYDDIVDHCCYAWNTLIALPWKIMSIGLRDWDYIGRTRCAGFPQLKVDLLANRGANQRV